jgi:hypothetical protein
VAAGGAPSSSDREDKTADLRLGGGFTANSCAPGMGGGRKEEEGDGKGDAEGGESTWRDSGRGAAGLQRSATEAMVAGLAGPARCHGHCCLRVFKVV